MEKSIVTFDLETTGTNTEKDQIVQYGFYKITVDFEVLELYSLVKPTIPIEKGASDVTGITNDMVSKEKLFKEHAEEIVEFIENCIFAGYNIIKFDIPILIKELQRAGIKDAVKYFSYPMMDAMVLYGKYRPRTLSAAYEDMTGKKMSDDAHDAMVDVKATYEVLSALAINYQKEDGDGSLERLVKESTPENAVDFAGKLKMEDGRIVYTFGKHKGKEVTENSETREYARWMLKSDFPEETKIILKQLLKIKR